MSLYDVLGVAPDADVARIKKAYRQLILKTHPDKLLECGPAEHREDVSELVSSIKAAYDTLSNAESRREYDLLLATSVQKQGFNLNGDGLDSYGLETFAYIEVAPESSAALEVVQHHEEGQNGDEMVPNWVKTCPRCETVDSIRLTEEDLEQGTDDGQGGLELLVQCGSCSLWIKVHYVEE